MKSSFKVIVVAAMLVQLAVPTMSAVAAESSTKQARLDPSLEIDLGQLIAPIRSEKALAAYVKFSARTWTPLHHLSERDRQAFLSSLVFTTEGVASFEHAPLRNLTPSQAYEVLSLFGLQHAIPAKSLSRAETALDDDILRRQEDLESQSCMEPKLPGSVSPSQTCGPGQTYNNMYCGATGPRSKGCLSKQGSTCDLNKCS